jgi:hypothetical protein
LKGGERLPVKNIELKNIHVDMLVDSISYVGNVEKIITENITFNQINSDSLPELKQKLNNK